ncbi:MAG: hypothetical protein ABEK04_05985 [Candidatus Nanohalobium sp.]
MTVHISLDEWKEEFRPITTEDVAEAISQDSSWTSSQTGMGRLHEMQIVEKLDNLSGLDRVVEIGSNEGLTTLELSMILPEAAVTGVDIDDKAVEKAVQNREALETFQEFLSKLPSDNYSAEKAIGQCDQESLGIDVDMSRYFSDHIDRFSFRSFAQNSYVVEPVEHVSYLISKGDKDWESMLNDYVEDMRKIGDVDFRNLGALQTSEAGTDYDLVFAPNSVGTLDNTAVFSRLGKLKRDESELYNKAREEADNSMEVIEEATGKTTQAAREVFMEQFLDEAAEVTGENGALLIADGRQYLHMEYNDGWQAVEGRGAVNERKSGMCKTYEEKRADALYEGWLALDNVDTEGYVEKMLNENGEEETLYQVINGEKVDLS